MILKKYQRRVLEDLTSYLNILQDKISLPKVYDEFWQGRNIKPGHFKEIPPYKDNLAGVPSVCLKVPTGGGKTFIACNALKRIFDKFMVNNKVVVWLVPYDAILTQTLAALKNPDHPYRRQINSDFNHRVRVYTKEELLNGQNFNPVSVSSQLSIMVLSYDSFRSNKDYLKARKSNPNLTAFHVGKIDKPVEGADADSLIQTINGLNPIIIVDESHHAKSKLSLEMLQNFNPRFVLELTATPRSESNIISFVNAEELKAESMVKLPVIVYPQNERAQVITRAIELRKNLEESAAAELQNGGRYIRPIVLFQAQPNISDKAETFDKIRKQLIDNYNIPKEQIAIRTANINELKTENLLSEDCEIRYIITINALKEGWDCPFAYILASLANKNSAVDVEQILGRILRLPNTRSSKYPLLNMSYVLTASDQLRNTLNNIVKELNGEGFSNMDCRVFHKSKLVAPTLDFETPLNVNEPSINNYVSPPVNEFTAALIKKSIQTEKISTPEEFNNLPAQVVRQMPRYTVRKEFNDDVMNIMVPQFCLDIKAGDSNNMQISLLDTLAILEKEDLVVDFKLNNEASNINFDGINYEMYKIDADKGGAIISKVEMELHDYITEHSTTPEERTRLSSDTIVNWLDNKYEKISKSDLKTYVNRIIENFNDEQLAELHKYTLRFAYRIKEMIDLLIVKHSERTFYKRLANNEIICKPLYKMKRTINPNNAVTNIKRSLYTGEGSMNSMEQQFALDLTALDNIKWWHRNIAKSEFCINGFINHYPDFMIMTTRGRIIFAETKGNFLNNEDTARKAKLGHTWAAKAGDIYDYFMIFDDSNINDLPNSIINKNEFMGIVRNL